MNAARQTDCLITCTVILDTHTRSYLRAKPVAPWAPTWLTRYEKRCEPRLWASDSRTPLGTNLITRETSSGFRSHVSGRCNLLTVGRKLSRCRRNSNTEIILRYVFPLRAYQGDNSVEERVQFSVQLSPGKTLPQRKDYLDEIYRLLPGPPRRSLPPPRRGTSSWAVSRSGWFSSETSPANWGGGKKQFRTCTSIFQRCNTFRATPQPFLDTSSRPICIQAHHTYRHESQCSVMAFN